MAFTINSAIKSRVAIAAVTASALVLTGCGGGNDAPSVEDDPAPIDAPADNGTDDAPDDTPDDGTATTVTASASEFTFALSQSDFQAGTYTFELMNDGSMEHDLIIEGPGVAAASSVVAPGESTTLTVDLESGTYVLWCSIGNHRGMGMEVTIDVS